MQAAALLRLIRHSPRPNLFCEFLRCFPGLSPIHVKASFELMFIQDSFALSSNTFSSGFSNLPVAHCRGRLLGQGHHVIGITPISR